MSGELDKALQRFQQTRQIYSPIIPTPREAAQMIKAENIREQDNPLFAEAEPLYPPTWLDILRKKRTNTLL